MVECSKIILVTINVIFMIFGLAVLIVGIVFKVGFDAVKDALIDNSGDFNLQNAGSTLGIGVIIFGCFILLLAIMGCVGACCRIRCLLVLYAIIVIILLIAEIGVVAYIGIQGQKALDTIDNGLLKALDGYTEDSTDTKSKAFNAIFQTFGCCGVYNYTDFQRININWSSKDTFQNIPIACCQRVKYESLPNVNYTEFRPCLQNPTKDNAYTSGCVTSLKDTITKYKGVAIGVGVAIFLVEILVVVMAFVLCRSSDDKYV